MRGIFLSYRREDSFLHTKNLYDKLTRQFGRDKVFMDVDSILTGEDFRNAINMTLSSCAVMIVVIGRGWMALMNQRLASLEDLVRDEIRVALTKRIHIVPVLVDGAQMPHHKDLPEDITTLARLNAHEISNLRYDNDVNRLVLELKKINRLKGKLHTKLLVADIEEVKRWGWNGQKLMDELLAMDREYMQGLTEEEEGGSDQWGPIVWNYPDTWRLLMISLDQPDSIVGNWQFVPLFESDYDLARKGELPDNEITADKVKPLFPGWYDIYFVAVVMLPEFRRVPYLESLIRSVLDHFIHLAQKGIFIDRICANAYTLEGEALCKYFEFYRVGSHISHGAIYERTLYPFPSSTLFKDYKELGRLYGKAVKLRKGE